MDKVRKKLEISDIKSLKIAKNTFVYISIALYCLFTFIRYPIFTSYENKTAYNFPLAAVEFLKKNNLKGNILSPFQYSSYIAYKTYPSMKIFMDGRQEQVYHEGVFDDLMNFLHQNKNGNDIFRKYETNYILTTKNFACYNYLLSSKDWKLIFEDERFYIFAQKDIIKNTYIKPEKSNAQLIKDMFKSDFLKEGYKI